MASNLKANLFLKTFGRTKVPMIGWVGPKVLELTPERCVVRIKLRRRTRNHMNSMYIGVLTVGADVAGGLIAADRIRESGKKVALLFKDIRAEFHRRPEADTVFTCDEGRAITELVEETLRTGERVHRTVQIVASCPSVGPEPVATFWLTISLRHKP